MAWRRDNHIDVPNRSASRTLSTESGIAGVDSLQRQCLNLNGVTGLHFEFKTAQAAAKVEGPTCHIEAPGRGVAPRVLPWTREKTFQS